MRDNYIKTKEVEYIKINQYIKFYKSIPKKLWSSVPVFYFKNGKFDALGLIGEKIHQFNIYSKTLELYLKDILDIRITEAIDGRHNLYSDIKCSKKRFINYLTYLKNNHEKDDLRKAYVKAKRILHGRYY